MQLSSPCDLGEQRTLCFKNTYLKEGGEAVASVPVEYPFMATSHEESNRESDPEYVDAKSMRFDTLAGLTFAYLCKLLAQSAVQPLPGVASSAAHHRHQARR